MPDERPHPGAWAQLSDEEIARREAEAEAREQAARDAEVSERQWNVDDEEPLDPQVVQIRILAELQTIRYRLGVLVLFFVVIPIAVGLIVGFAVGFNNS